MRFDFSLGVFISLSVALFFFVHAQEQSSSIFAGEARFDVDFDAAARQIIELTNQFRKKEGRRELTANEELTRAAQYFADFMARTDKYGHTADGKQPADRAKQFGYQYCIIAENIAWEFKTSGFTTEGLAESLFNGWKNSPEHRANMLDPDVYDIGVAVARSEKTGRYYGVQEFGRPRSKAISFEIANRANGPVRYTVDDESFTLPERYTRSHRACRPPKLRVRLGPEENAKESDVLRPADGARYVIRQNSSGAYTIEQK
jgi:uncharacterized protein YkwD